MKLCVALDMASKEQNLALSANLAQFGDQIWLKVGLRSYLRDGAKFIEELKKIANFKIFLDLKFYDIPNTMADASQVVAGFGVDMINLHASAGKRAMSEVMNRLDALNTRPLVLGVSALTSFNESEFGEIYNDEIAPSVVKFSRFAHECGLDGMVCSVFESSAIKNATSDEFITLCPGVRPFGESANDQARVANLSDAKSANADFIVVGRPIYQAQNPEQIVNQILASL
ncbi:orotidine-5'-phosphate decarboxylase [Campylobacter sp. JMF_06 NA1]|uniref:orotidine-5'-phosphate decarboxylase n=1 Tax=Campylobacter sp. JMF_06 NA1 TaxID=2983823 RepID=UPI0022E9AE23|nr:orotidine-5'-phosphate decarboxylase [Campylobacter sp. JMF_06 NA1]MDA3078124.1 orotidine-5'-phosphate decarboxylase [Campylobacter sp. JMF_06 NA1]